EYNFFNTIRFYTSSALKPSNHITGTIFSDSNGNCEKDIDDQGLEGILVSATPGPYFTRTDKLGKYTLEVGEGEYTVSQVLNEQVGRQIQLICSTNEKDKTVVFHNNSNS